jgi:uncharacterized protein YciI
LRAITLDASDKRRNHLAEADPYFHAGVWHAIEIYDFNAVAWDWVDGKAWG